MPRKFFYLAILATSGMISILIVQKSLIAEPNFRPDTFRKILDSPSEEAIYEPLYVPTQRNYSQNFPEILLDDKSPKPKGSNNSCAKFPNFFDVQFRNNHWQMQRTSNGTFFLFGAHIDRRNGTAVRIVGLLDAYRPTVTYYCQFWYKEKSAPVVVESEKLLWLFREKWGADKGYFYQPYIITCPLDITEPLPFSVSLVEEPCVNATNNLKVRNREITEKKNFVVCVKGLSFPDQDKSVRLTEWIELLGILGAEKINFYEFSVSRNTKKILDYYEALGRIEVTPLSLVGDVSNLPLQQNIFLHKKVVQRRLEEVIPYNDCFYKHLEEYKYVVLLDTDEVIAPTNKTWVELIETLQNKYPNQSSYLARNIYFLDDPQHQHDWFEGIPRYMHMLQHVHRAKNYTKPGFFVKGFHDTRRVIGLHNHFPFYCLGGCKSKEIDLSLAHMQHYRADCASGVSDCKTMKETSVMDRRVWNHKDELMKRVEKTLEEVGLSYT